MRNNCSSLSEYVWIWDVSVVINLSYIGNIWIWALSVLCKKNPSVCNGSRHPRNCYRYGSWEKVWRWLALEILHSAPWGAVPTPPGATHAVLPLGWAPVPSWHWGVTRVLLPWTHQGLKVGNSAGMLLKSDETFRYYFYLIGLSWE